jgi:hypothetical protein
MSRFYMQGHGRTLMDQKKASVVVVVVIQI